MGRERIVVVLYSSTIDIFVFDFRKDQHKILMVTRSKDQENWGQEALGQNEGTIVFFFTTETNNNQETIIRIAMHLHIIT